MPILQGRLRGKRWIVGSSTHGCWLGSYEYHKRRRFERTVRSGQVVYDVGANAGFYTILASVLVGPTGKVVAFEPVPRNLDYLQRHIELNRLTNVTVVPAAVSDGDGQGCFREGPHPSMGSLAQGGALRVRTVSLDRLIKEGRVPPPDVVKMDIEGGEYRALLRARTILGRATGPTLFLSTHGADVHARCLALLGSLGYELRPFDGKDLGSCTEVIAER
jgi:FkbM family methyltransferase